MKGKLNKLKRKSTEVVEVKKEAPKKAAPKKTTKKK